MEKHTPAPWILCHHLQSKENDESCSCGYRGGIWGNDEEHMICEMGSTSTIGEEALAPPRYDRDIELANARLIVAAPEMLAELEDQKKWLSELFMVSFSRDGMNEATQEISERHDKCEAVIKKARGES